jgi:glycosyltransferase involved in cell wall biosynthesis
VEHVGAPRAWAERTDPFVSVVTVSLNAAATIEDTIASVSLQETGFNLEHVCVDGGSVDGTRAIIDRWAAQSRRICKIYEADRGIFDAMNKGLRAARGEYVLFLNADDFLVAPNTLAAAMCGLTPRSCDNPDLVVGDVAMGEPGSRGVWRCRNVPRLLPRLRGSGLYPPHQGMFAKRCLLEAVGGFDAKLRFAADLNQYYDLERRFRPSMRLLRSHVAFMRPGGSANSSPGAVLRGSIEIYQHLRPIHGAVRAAAMVLAKTLQSAAEVRYGTTGQQRWFSRPQPAAE